MKKLINLQLFADEPNNDNPNTDPAAGTPAPEPEKDDPKKYTDEDVNRIVKAKRAEWLKQKEKDANEAERLGRMTAEEKANERLKSLEDRIKEYEQKDAKERMMRQARLILQDKDIHANDELIASLIADANDADSTKAAVDSFIELFEAAVEAKVKDKVKGETPKTGKPTSLTKEQILAVTNRAERQRLIKENIELFN